MNEYVSAAVALLGVIGLILKYVLSEDAQKTIREREIRTQEQLEQQAIQKEIDSQSNLTNGFNNAWTAADEDKNF